MTIPVRKDFQNEREWADALVRWLVDNGLDTADAISRNPPIGAIVEWPAVSAPAGWLLCNGASYSTSRYPRLALVLGAGGATLTVPTSAGKIIRAI